MTRREAAIVEVYTGYVTLRGDLRECVYQYASELLKRRITPFVAWYKRELAKYPVRVHMETEVKSLDELDTDEIVLATGGTVKNLPIPGGEKTIPVTDMLLDSTASGETVAIIGGGLAGCELAYDLAVKGKKPFIIEMQDALIKDINVNAANSQLMRDLLKFHQVPVYLNAKTLRVHDGSIVIENADGQKELSCDSVVRATGFNPNVSLLSGKNKHVHVIGDADKVSNLKGAVWGANNLILKLSK